jgi:hypothetical protein
MASHCVGVSFQASPDQPGEPMTINPYTPSMGERITSRGLLINIFEELGH